MEIPKWFDNPDAPWPCPCGNPPQGQMLLLELEHGGTMVVHAQCAIASGALEDDDGPDG